MTFPMWFPNWFHLVSVAVALDDQCHLQIWKGFGELQPNLPRDTLDQFNGSFKTMQDIWTTPGHFPQCSSRPRLLEKRTKTTQFLQVPSHLPDKITCKPGDVLIGNFEGNSYTFSCCAGAQCGGCRRNKNHECLECAAGYVHQVIPVMGVSKCFICDDIPNWEDSMSRTCSDYALQGLCTGSWPNGSLDLPYHGLRPSEACCACGGGSVQPTLAKMPLAGQSVYVGQKVEAFPEPVAEAVEVNSECNLAELGLEIATTGAIRGTGNKTSELKCSMILMQDPVRGIFSSINLDVPVSAFSYGEQVLLFKFWGLDATPMKSSFPVQKDPALQLQNYGLKCVPECPWLELDQVDGSLSLQSNLSMEKFPSDMKGSVEGFQKMASCSCQASAQSGNGSQSTDFIALRARLWLSGSYAHTVIVARMGADIEDVALLEDPGPGLAWYQGPDNSAFELPILQNVSTGERFVISPSISPMILDVKCIDTMNDTYAWSRITGDVTLRGQVAFNLNPESGSVSGVPALDLLDTQGRASVVINCQVALGGPAYDKVLPVVNFAVKILDDVCWVPSNISGAALWQMLHVPKKSCIRMCRLRADCGAVHYDAHDPHGACYMMLSEATNFPNSSNEPPNSTLKNFDRALVRLNNCSEDDTSLNLQVPGAWYVDGHFSPSNSYKNQESYSHAGSTPGRQFNLVQSGFVQGQGCHNATWTLLHTNSSDYKDGDTDMPEYFGSEMACAYEDVVGAAFQVGETSFALKFLPAELSDPAVVDKPSALQSATLTLSVPSCAKPEIDAEHFLLGKLEDTAFYSLHSCECFGEAYSHAAPVEESSNDAVPRNSGSFNNGSLQDQLIFTGPFTCEGNAKLDELRSTTLEGCAKDCRGKKSCRFYQFEATSGDCLLFEQCDYLQRINVPVENTLYGIPPNGHFCRIADPVGCWQEIKRRSLLSLTPSDLPSCIFQAQFEACDALQMISGQERGQCSVCEYIDSSTPYALRGMQKLPPPDEFPAASQVTISCNATARLFAKHSDYGYDGPRPSAAFTCVSGEWVGEPGPWQFLSNLTCEECLQVGTRSLQELSLVSMPQVYFLEHREIHVTHGTASPGCAKTGPLTPSPLLASESNLFLVAVDGSDAKASHLKLSTNKSQVFFLDEEDRLQVVLDSGGQQCICSEDGQSLSLCPCSKASWIMTWQILMDPKGVYCAFKSDKGDSLIVKPCGDAPDTWYFQSGTCFVGMDMVDTASKAWNVTVATKDQTLELMEFEYDAEVTNRTVELFQIRLEDACVEADWSCKWTNSKGTYHCVVVSATCTDAFGFAEDYVLRYYPNGDLTQGPYYLWAGCPEGFDPWKCENSRLWVVGSAAEVSHWEMGSNYIKQRGSELSLVASTEPVGMTAFPTQTLGTGECPPALLSIIAGRIQKESGEHFNSDYQECANTAPLSFYAVGCGEWTQAYKKDTTSVSIECPEGQVLQEVSGHFASEGWKPGEAGTITYQCCDLQLPPRTKRMGDDLMTEGVVSAPEGDDGDYSFSCKDVPGLLTRFKWAEHSHDAAALCYQYWHVPIGAALVLEDCSPSPLTPWHPPCPRNWQHFDFPKYHSNQSDGSQIFASNCMASVSVVANQTTRDAESLKLEVQNREKLSSELLMAYTSVPSMQVQVQSETLFSCRQSPNGPVFENNVNSTLCANLVPVSNRDLLSAAGVVSNSGDQSLLVKKTCPVFMRSSQRPKHAKVISAKGLSMDGFFNILQNQVYRSVPFSSARHPPFDFRGQSMTQAHLVGFLSLSPVGEAFWGVKCPPGAVVASQQLMLPYCLQIGAGTEQVFTSFSGSATCPLGSAVSGWYNLPAVPVKASALSPMGGPKNFTGLQLFCAKTALLSFCEQPQHSQCSKGHVVASISYGSNNFKLGCCQLQSRLGLHLTARSPVDHSYKQFEGYYCPTKMGITGAAVYTKTKIASLGDPRGLGSSGGHPEWTLTWDKFRGSWDLRANTKLRASIQSGNVVPVDMNGSSDFFSATFIRPLTNGYLVKVKVKQPFPQKKPTYPKLVEFHAVSPDYAAYCNPTVLQNPGAFQTSVEETNPCYHTFNAEVVKGVPATKGISEQAFWNCADRERARNYMGAMTTAGKEKTEYKIQETVDLLTDITLALQLVSGVAGMIPWGSYAAPGEKGAEKGGKAVEQKEKKVVKKEVEKDVESEVKKEEKEVKRDVAKLQEKTVEKALAAQKAAEEAAKADSAMAVLGRFYNKHNKQFDSFVKTVKATGHTVAWIQKVRARKQKGEKGASKEVEDKTIPTLEGPTYKQTSEMAKSTANDCLPLQFGLSKVMCDLFCVQNSVREGTHAILSSLEDSQQVLMQNLQALLNYQTEYILWAIGTVINKKPETTLLSEIPSPSGLLEELRRIDFEDAKATVPSVSRDVLDWHRSTAPELYGRMAVMSVNATPQNWPYRVRSMRSMLQHFQAEFRGRIYRKASQDRQMKDKLQLLRDDTVKHRRQAEQAHLLRFQMSMSPMGTERMWTSILDSFLHCHEKHNTFTMMQLRALDQHDTALNLAQNFSHCKADTAELHETWQRAMHAEARTEEALLEAWSATVTTAERLAMAFEEDFLSALNFDLSRSQASSQLHLRESCHSMSKLTQKLYLEAVSHVDSTLKPLSMQLIIFNALAKYQEHYLLNKRLDYIPLPIFMLPKSKLTAIADPKGHGTQLAIQALQALGRELCPAPPSCPQGMLLPDDVSSAVQQMDEVEQCNHGGRSAFVGIMTYNLAEALMQNVSLQPVGLTSVSLLELSELYS